VKRVFVLALFGTLWLFGCSGGKPPPAPDLGNVTGESLLTPRTAANAAASINKADYKSLSFDILGSYNYEFPNMDGKPIEKGKLKTQIPENIQAFNGQKIAIRGFMIPLEFEDNGAKTFILSQFVPACCFGDTIKMNQWIEVKMAEGKRSQYRPTEPIVIYGTLEVGEELQDGYVASLYRRLQRLTLRAQTKKFQTVLDLGKAHPFHLPL
jgi:hypothetical protein